MTFRELICEATIHGFEIKGTTPAGKNAAKKFIDNMVKAYNFMEEGKEKNAKTSFDKALSYFSTVNGALPKEVLKMYDDLKPKLKPEN